MRVAAVQIILLLLLAGCRPEAPGAADPPEGGRSMSSKVETVHHTDAEWMKELTPEQYHVLREKGTEAAFTGKYWNNHEPGVYRCAGCGQELFRSDEKFDSGTGWPSFWDVVAKGRVKIVGDHSHGMERDEVVCSRCGGHLGHVFDDGPKPTGLRYCINSVSLTFAKGEEKAK
jgi:peptide-methionine (R)-S-oxide reductase